MDCVIFSSWVPPHLFHRGEQYLKYLLEYFGDCDIYCGVNWGSDPRWLDLLHEYRCKGLRIEYKCVAPCMASTSDNAGYQAALSLFKLSDKEYEFAFFTHTKSITHNDNNHREGVEHMIVSFHKNKERSRRILRQNVRLGGWSAVGRINYEHISLNKLDEFHKFNYKALELTFVLTNFVMKSNILRSFIISCDEKFFLVPFEKMGFNRYFFEFYFPTIISKSGYIPLVDECWDVSSQQQARTETLANFERWKQQLGSLAPYVIYPTSFEGMKP